MPTGKRGSPMGHHAHLDIASRDEPLALLDRAIEAIARAETTPIRAQPAGNLPDAEPNLHRQVLNELLAGVAPLALEHRVLTRHPATGPGPTSHHDPDRSSLCIKHHCHRATCSTAHLGSGQLRVTDTSTGFNHVSHTQLR